MKFSNLHHRVLYAEDNKDSRELVIMMCQMSGIEVITAETVAETWRLAQSEPFDLYLLDSGFPTATAWNCAAVCASLLRSLRFSFIPATLMKPTGKRDSRREPAII